MFSHLALLALCLPLETPSSPPDPGTADRAPIEFERSGLSAADRAGIRAAHEAARYAVRPVEGGHRADNPGQRWSTDFDGLGFTTTPETGTWTWGLELLGYGWGATEAGVSAPAAVTCDGSRVTYDWGAGVREWFVNDARGLEHGYTLDARPAAAAGSLTLELAVRGGLEPRVAQDGRDVGFEDERGRTVLDYDGLVVLDADGRELAAGFERSERGLRLRVDDRDARYPLTIDPIAQQAYLKASNSETGDTFGQAVSVSGDTVVVGAPGEDGASTGVNGDETSNGASGSGAAYVFVHDGTGWTQQAYLKASNTGFLDFFGTSVAISGDTLVVGATFEQSSATGVNGNQNDNSAFAAGAAYVFVRSGTSWSQQAYLKASNTEAGDLFGGSVAISGDTIVVAASSEDSAATGVDGDQVDDSAPSAGAAYVFVRNGTSWGQQAYLKASNTGSNDTFGDAVAVSGDTICVGAKREASAATGVDGDGNDNSVPGAGAAYVFARNGTTWSPQGYLKASNTGGVDDWFGAAVSASDDTIVVGAPQEDSDATGVGGDEGNDDAESAGAAYVFVRSGSTWSQQAYLKASNSGPSDQFGYSASIDGERIVVGAISESGASPGVNGDQGNNDATGAGAAYLFVRSGASWTQQAYLKASTPEAVNQFANAVSISGVRLVAGTVGDDSDATGINGDEDNNGAPSSGAAHVFDLDADDPYPAQCFGVACPCGNDSTNSGGCDNSLFGTGGALLSGSGVASLSNDSLVLTVQNTTNQPGIFFQGNNFLTPPSFGDGLRCCGGSVVRCGTYLASGNATNTATGNQIGGSPPPISDIGPNAGLSPGDVRCYQWWYRDPSGGPCSSSFNLSNSISVTWGA